MAPRLRIFLSSPGDVTQERLRAHFIIKNLLGTISAISSSSRSFGNTSRCWRRNISRMRLIRRAVSMSSYCSCGRAWARRCRKRPSCANIAASTAARLSPVRSGSSRTPFRRTAREAERARLTCLSIAGWGASRPRWTIAERRDEAIRQYEALEAFWRRWFKSGDQLLAGYTEYTEPHKLSSTAGWRPILKTHRAYIKERYLDEVVAHLAEGLAVSRAGRLRFRRCACVLRARSRNPRGTRPSGGIRRTRHGLSHGVRLQRLWQIVAGARWAAARAGRHESGASRLVATG